MIDLFTTFVTTVLALYVCYRASKLDRVLPWFATKNGSDKWMALARTPNTKAGKLREPEAKAPRDRRPAR